MRSRPTAARPTSAPGCCWRSARCDWASTVDKSALSHLDIDGRLLHLLAILVEEQSLTRAAERLDITQSAVSHLVAKLRRIVGDPLFVKAGRGVVATARALALAAEARALLDGMRHFAAGEDFDPAAFDGEVVIAANDLQRDLLLPALLARLRTAAPRLRLRVIPSNVPKAEMLREQRCHLAITPRPPDADDILQRRLFEDRYVCFYDAAVRQAPQTRDDYLAAEHVTVVYEKRGPLEIDRLLAEQGTQRRFAAVVPNFSGIAPFLRGSGYLATLPSLLGAGLLQGFAQAAPPLPCPGMPMYVVWHRRDHLDATNRWLRENLDAVVAGVVGTRATAAAPE
ncbi:MAG: LysR family transcriptional regulator [Rhodocyclales bacterium]|nr:LysR family transcriptional regulator [Rhodocyclales bacterium]